MNSMTRRRFFAGAGALTALAAVPTSAAADNPQGSEWSGGSEENATFRLSLSPGEGLKNTRLVHPASGLILADANYSYSFEPPTFESSQMEKSEDGSVWIHLQGSTWGGSLGILQRFHLPHNKPWLEEQVTLINRSSVPIDLSGERIGFVLPLTLEGAKVSGPWSDFKYTAVPYRREPRGNKSQYFDFSVEQILNEEFRSELMTYDTKTTPDYASEGWAWTDGKQGFLVTKYSQEGMEWSILDRVPLGKDRVGLRWGGFGMHLGEPEHGAWLLPGETHHYGVTRITAYQGGLLEGFYSFRQEMAERGHGCPKGFNPPVHWNELYDNKLWWTPGEDQGDPGVRKKYYQLADIKEEAAKAKAIGCQALYLDPGWDTLFGSKIWDETRMGSCKDFVDTLRRDYGLKLSLHTPLSGWCDPTAYPSEMYRMDRFGQRLTWGRRSGFGASPLCGASQPYIEETARRLKALAHDGATFFMFDGTGYRGECWDPQHGHPVPAGCEEHVQAISRLARMVHAEYPQVLIEMHDQVAGGSTIRPTPTYYGHGQAAPGEQVAEALGFNSVWAFELMWGPMEDLMTGHSIALYYYNLAYGLPLYIHIDLRKDNINAVEFWWNASTCRHLGIGGTHKDVAVQEAHHAAMATYRRLEAFFKAGTFYGLDEMVHVHAHPTESAAVVNCFNLEDQPARRTIEIDPAKVGLSSSLTYQIKGAPARREGSRYIVEVEIPSQGHVMFEMVQSA
jgi:hypothetical protein